MIILAAGKGSASGWQFGRRLPDAMVPVNGKPALGWILDDLLGKGIDSIVVVHRSDDRALETFVRRAYTPRARIHLVGVAESPSILHSLKAGLDPGADSGLVRVMLGDTLIQDDFDDAGDAVYVGTVEDVRRWCVVQTDPEGVVVDYLDKLGPGPGPRTALAGYYQFRDRQYLAECLDASLAAGERELSALLRRYGARHPIRARQVRRWLDFGHVDKLVEARRALLKPRHFNSLTVDPVLNTIRKVSSNTEKLQDEIDWYAALPLDLQVLTPRILKRALRDDQIEIEQEYYGYPTLAELYVYSELESDIWGSILRHVLRVHDVFRGRRGELSQVEIRSMYVDKTLERLDAACKQSPDLRRLVDSPSIRWNGRTLRGWPERRAPAMALAAHLAETAETSIIHGDLCFSNILFDLDSRILRLIDPRGRFGRKGIYGDPRYDLAKLRHSVAGLYDYILADMFDLREGTNGFESEIYATAEAAPVAGLFDEMLVEARHDLDEIKLIEGLLYFSMLPLHSEAPRRQKMMFLRGLDLLEAVS